MTTTAARLQLTLDTKNGIKQALIDKGIEVGDAPFSQYPTMISEIKGGGTPQVGTVATNKLDESALGWLPLAGGQYSQTTYPELYAVLGDSYNDGGEAEGYFRVPNEDPVTYGNVTVQPMMYAGEPVT